MKWIFLSDIWENYLSFFVKRLAWYLEESLILCSKFFFIVGWVTGKERDTFGSCYWNANWWRKTYYSNHWTVKSQIQILLILTKTESIYYNKKVITVCKQIKGKNLRLLISSDFKMFSSFLSLFYFFNLIGNEIFRLRCCVVWETTIQMSFLCGQKKN